MFNVNNVKSLFNKIYNRTIVQKKTHKLPNNNVTLSYIM